MNTEVLKKLNMTDNEIKVYLAMVDLGASSATKIAKTAQVHRSKAYDSLQRLLDKGIIRYSVKDYKKIFSITSPDELNKIIEDKETKIKQEKNELSLFIKQLKTKIIPEHEEYSNVYEGLTGIKVFHNQVLTRATKNDELLILGIPVIANELLEAFFVDFHKTRIKNKIPAKLLYSYNSRNKVKARNKMQFTKAKYLDKNIQTPAVVWIFKDTIGLFHFKPKPVCYEIRSEEIFTGFKSYFQYLWSLAK